MSDIMTKMAGGNQIKIGFGQAGGGAGRHGTGARFSMESSERARRAPPMGVPAIDVRELSDEMLIFMLQLMAPEKYGRVRGKSECGMVKIVVADQDGRWGAVKAVDVAALYTDFVFAMPGAFLDLDLTTTATFRGFST